MLPHIEIVFLMSYTIYIKKFFIVNQGYFRVLSIVITNGGLSQQIEGFYESD